jgi:hypothetical protein
MHLGDLALRRIGNGGDIELPYTCHRVPDEYDGEIASRCQDAEHQALRGGFEFRQLRGRHSHFAILDRALHLCLQDLEAPLERQFSSRALGVAEQTLETVAAAVAAAASTARCLIDHANDNNCHRSSLDPGQASQTK